jgi:2-polyprenyl-6-methoxyphenol hydroxylase-like FAD-dependent oxidoreductase
MWGRGRRFGLVPLTRDRVYCFAVANAPVGEPDPEHGRVERFRTRFGGFGGDVPAVLEQIERPEQLIHNDLEEIEQTPWQRDRVVLVGDAAHAVTPNMGQGAAMALEDTAVLAEMLAEKRPLAETLAAWEARRRPRVRFVQRQSRRIGRVAHRQGRAACAVRNGLLRLTPDRAAAAALARLVGRPF